MCKRPTLYYTQGVEPKLNFDASEGREKAMEQGSKAIQLVDNEEPEISIHAIVGILTLNTMGLLGNFNGILVEILEDLGSTNNFLEPLVARRAKLNVNEVPSLMVCIANGDTIKSEGCYQQVSFKAQGTHFQSSFHLLKLGGCDMVLGIKWLEILGLIMWDFANSYIQFTLNGSKGIKHSTVPL